MGTLQRNKPSTSEVATVTVAASSGTKRCISEIHYSYGSTGTVVGGNLKVESPSGTIIYDVDIVGKEYGMLKFEDGLEGALSQAMIVTLADAGADVQGIINVFVRS